MRNATVIIGAGFGDEGKGLMTDYHAAPAGDDGLVVRFNGGAQAGHTVIAEDGRRHVFSHFGAASFSGARTYLSRFFVLNPLLYFKEAEQLARLGIAPRVFADIACPVTTPYDMLINQLAEQARGEGRHGSVGVGFGETIERNLDPRYAITFADLSNYDRLAFRLRKIRDEWVAPRLAALGIASLSGSKKDLLESETLIERFLADTQDFLSQVEPGGVDILSGARHIVFEGAQGLLLDQDRGSFPHVTRSNTGLKNVLALAVEAGFDSLEAVYVSRSYKTRHGAGPFPHAFTDDADHRTMTFEKADEERVPEVITWPRIEDRTNVDNDYQGGLRFGLLDIDGLARDIHNDLSDARATPHIAISHRLAMTCLDQLTERAHFILGGRICEASPSALFAAAVHAVGGSEPLSSYGPARGDIQRRPSDKRLKHSVV